MTDLDWFVATLLLEIKKQRYVAAQHENREYGDVGQSSLLENFNFFIDLGCCFRFQGSHLGGIHGCVFAKQVAALY